MARWTCRECRGRNPDALDRCQYCRTPRVPDTDAEHINGEVI